MWDIANPPNQPPSDCHSPERWHMWHPIFISHNDNRCGRCKQCGEVFPCLQRQLASRSLLDACAIPRSFEPKPGPNQVLASAMCRWCGTKIELHSAFGWIHAVDAFYLCRKVRESSPPLTVAEPEARSSRSTTEINLP